uniref:AlNc14C484G11900 protein n=1 Tax=Albugo laibachii Nc14 TaxID=890382 RepID=F0X0F8_9STRA|nr:AlNc14C484G11900 [Albugo laibachii Nc14]|eukprot:CCA27246.1 AlNc14C484G11900 [Albugo laibachii Nc14]
MDAEVIKNFKISVLVRAVVSRPALAMRQHDSTKKMDVLTAVTPDTIRHCWFHTGIVDVAIATTLIQENEPKRVFANSHLDPLLSNAYIAYDVDVEERVKDDEMEVDSSSSEEDEINQLLTHREALALCEQLATYTFTHGIESRYVLVIAKQSRKQLLGSLRQTSITNYC